LRDISSIEKDFKQKMNEINKELDSLISIMDYINDSIANNVEVNVVKQTIKLQNIDLYNELNIGMASSLVDIQQSFS
jgi:predicted translin family RNA/ssDNA-binding protein